jgi:hypothetical protein
VIVSVLVRFCAFRATLTVRTEVPELWIDAGLNVAVVRAGTPLTVRFTAPENPCPAVTVTVYDVTLFLATVRDVGVTAMVKSPLATTSVTLAVRVTGPLVARIVSG